MYPETRGVPLEKMSELFENKAVEDEEGYAGERTPLARSRSNSRSVSPSRRSLQQPHQQPTTDVQPPDLKDDDHSHTNVLGRLFGQEVRPGSSRQNSYDVVRTHDPDEPTESPLTGEGPPTRRGGYAAVAGGGTESRTLTAE